MPKKSSKIKNQKVKKAVASASLAGSLLLTPSSESLKALPDKPHELRLPSGLISSSDLKKLLKKSLSKILPPSSRVLTEKEELALTKTIKATLGIKAVAELDGNRLNHQLGLMGLEQHLKRYPGDTLSGRNFPKVGLAPGKGAWGYFATSRANLVSSHIEMEKYYLAVQTLYLPDWQSRLRELRDWYKYRKVIVINPQTGAAVVAVIADAGPAKWTGKQFGGSPQVMYDLGFYPKRTTAKTLVLFVDDPENKVPLGPIDYPVNQKKPSLI